MKVTLYKFSASDIQGNNNDYILSEKFKHVLFFKLILVLLTVSLINEYKHIYVFYDFIT